MEVASKIDNSIAWYNRNWTAIQDATPISHEGTTYPAAYFPGLEKFCADWQRGTLPQRLAESYILMPLRRIRAALALKSNQPQAPHFAITLHRPWAYATLTLGKKIENRGWSCPLPVGSWVAIHAGKQWDAEGEAWIERMGLGLVGDPEFHPEMAIVGIVQFGGNTEASDSPWFVGPLGWQWLNTHTLQTPIPCRGKQKLWALSPELISKIKEQI